MSRFALVYTALGLGAIALVGFVWLGGQAQNAPIPEADLAVLDSLRVGEMQKLALHRAAKPLPDVAVETRQGEAVRMSDYKDKVVVLNFWATWCAPCRKEMPALDALNRELGGEDFEVVLIATGLNPAPAIDTFFAQAGIETLETLLDPRQKAAAAMAVPGLPVTLLLNREGREIARVQGEADWHAPETLAFLKAVIALGTGE
ncbi:MAG: TlpA family protein disulfide reductase [Rhodobacteraceae bacterium]|nr:TlpA family protein disulfide reductase [Paracoccaceae bacterium]